MKSDETERESDLAEFLRKVEAAPQIAADPNVVTETRNWTREADAIEASDWLAEHDRKLIEASTAKLKRISDIYVGALDTSTEEFDNPSAALDEIWDVLNE